MQIPRFTWFGPRCVCTPDSQHFHRKVEDYQIYEGSVRAHLTKVNTEVSARPSPNLGPHRGGDDDFAKDLAQAILVSHLDMITAVLDFSAFLMKTGSSPRI